MIISAISLLSVLAALVCNLYTRGKDGSKHLIFMYIYGIQSDRMHSFHPKHSNLENRCFRYIRPQKSPKKAQKQRIFWMVPGDSSCPDGSEYVW